MSPVAVAGRKIAQTFWGKAWCDNLERYRDFAYRLERGRSYLRSGSVIDLRIEAGKIAAMVSGSSLYNVAIEIDAVKRDAWRAIQRDCAGGIGSRLDLLSGKLSGPVMTRLCADRMGLFPDPSAIRFTCSCPDHATMCKHVAAAMYGVGARLDQAPELLFTLRRVSVDELLASAVTELPATPSAARVLAANGLASLFGIELDDGPMPQAGKPAPRGGSSPTTTTGRTATPKPARAADAAGTQRARRSAAPATRSAPRVIQDPYTTQPARSATTAARSGGKPAARSTATAARSGGKPAARSTATAARSGGKRAARSAATAARAARPVTRKPRAGGRPTPPAARR
jgi:uncharacterized Zn finger protein